MTQFSASNQPENKRGSKNKKTLLIEALKANGKTEQGFYDELVKRAVDDNDSILLKEVLLRLYPPSRSAMPTVEFVFPENATPVEKIDSVISAVASGDIPVDIGKSLADIIQSRLDILDRTELVERLERLEKLIKSQ